MLFETTDWNAEYSHRSGALYFTSPNHSLMVAILHVRLALLVLHHPAKSRFPVHWYILVKTLHKECQQLSIF